VVLHRPSSKGFQFAGRAGNYSGKRDSARLPSIGGIVFPGRDGSYTKDRCGLFGMIPSPEDLAQEGNHCPEDYRSPFERVFLASETFRSQQADHLVAMLLHFLCFPAGKVRLEIVVGGVTLRQKTAGREENDPLFCDSLHVLHQLEPIVFGKVFDDVQGNTSIKLIWRKAPAQISEIVANHLLVQPAFPGLLEIRTVTFQAGAMGHTQQLHRRRFSAPHIQNALASDQGAADRQHHEHLRGIISSFNEGDYQTHPAFHFVIRSLCRGDAIQTDAARATKNAVLRRKTPE